MKGLVNEVCPMFGLACRHCSSEHAIRPYTEIRKDPITKLYTPVRTGSKKTPIGLYCNDAGMWIDEMHYCTVIWGNANLREKKPKKQKVIKRTTPIAKPAKKHTRGKSPIVRSVKASTSKLPKKSIIVKKERGVKKRGRPRKVQSSIIQL